MIWKEKWEHLVVLYVKRHCNYNKAWTKWSVLQIAQIYFRLKFPGWAFACACHSHQFALAGRALDTLWMSWNVAGVCSGQRCAEPGHWAAVVLLISAGGRGCWLFSPRGPTPAASATPGAETAASAEGHIDKGNAAAPTAAAGTDPFTSSSRSQKHPGNPSS